MGDRYCQLLKEVEQTTPEYQKEISEFADNVIMEITNVFTKEKGVEALFDAEKRRPLCLKIKKAIRNSDLASDVKEIIEGILLKVAGQLDKDEDWKNAEVSLKSVSNKIEAEGYTGEVYNELKNLEKIVEGNMRAGILANLGYCASFSGDYEKGKTYIYEAIELCSSSPLLMMQCASVLSFVYKKKMDNQEKDEEILSKIKGILSMDFAGIPVNRTSLCESKVITLLNIREIDEALKVIEGSKVYFDGNESRLQRVLWQLQGFLLLLKGFEGGNCLFVEVSNLQEIIKDLTKVCGQLEKQLNDRKSR